GAAPRRRRRRAGRIPDLAHRQRGGRDGPGAGGDHRDDGSAQQPDRELPRRPAGARTAAIGAIVGPAALAAGGPARDHAGAGAGGDQLSASFWLMGPATLFSGGSTEDRRSPMNNRSKVRE